MGIKLPRINKKGIVNYFFLVFVTALILFLFIFSLPQTEQYLKLPSNSVNITDSKFWDKTFIAELNFEGINPSDKWNLINSVKNNLYSRLNKYGVEMVNIVYKDGEKIGTFNINIRSSKELQRVQALVAQNGDLKIVIKKDEANFQDEKNPYAAYLPDNYNDSNLNKSDLRTIYVTKLKTTSDEYAYFGIIKPWIWNTGKYNKFLSDNGGKDGGINVDGFVTPTSIPLLSGSSSQGAAKPIFAFLVGTDIENSKAQGIVLNSTPLPSNYTFKEVKDNQPNNISYNYYLVFGALVGSILVSLLVSKYVFKSEFTLPALSILVAFTLLISYLKFTQTEVLSISLVLTLGITTLFTIIFTQSKNKLFVSIPFMILLVLMAFPNKSYFTLFAPYTLVLSVLVILLSPLLKTYLELFKNTLRR